MKLNWTTKYGSWELDFTIPKIMAILNLTPDSFSDGGLYFNSEKAIKGARNLIKQGADILDIGAESSRPGAAALSHDEEWERLANVLKSLSNCQVPISIDTYKASIAEEAIKNGAAIINDIYGGRKDPNILKVVAEYKVPIVLMHMQGEPSTMQKNPQYENVVEEVHNFLLKQAEKALALGIEKNKIILDPGIGFGKNVGHNLKLIKNFEKVIPKGFLSVMALSRKAFLGALVHKKEKIEASLRDNASVVANTIALEKGANIIRVHNVVLAKESILVQNAIAGAN